MIRKLLTLVLAIVVIASMVVVGCTKPAPTTPTTPTTPTPAVVLRLGEPHTQGPYFDFSKAFCSLASEFSGGRVKIEYYPGDLLGDYTHQMEAVSAGTQDICFAWPSSGVHPAFGITWTGYIFLNWENALKAMQPGFWFREAHMEPCAASNYYPVAFVPNQFYVVGSTVKIDPYLPENIKELGIRCRVNMPETAATMNSIGYRSLEVPLAEVETGLKQGMMEGCANNDYQQIWDFRDLVKYCYADKHLTGYLLGVMNLDAWNSLSAQDQEALERASSAAVDEVGWEKFAEEDIKQSLIDYGIEVVDVSDEEVYACAKKCREEAWPEIEKRMGKELMDLIRANCDSIPS